MGDYRKLRVWQLACEFSDGVHELTARLPEPVRGYAQEQLVPAADGIHENLAEGCGFNSDRQLLKYARQALSTANESEDELLALDRRGYLREADSRLLAQIRSICAMLAVFIQRLETSVSRSRKPSARSRDRKPRAETDSREPGP
jgi:four helix bundle protein